MNEWNSDLRRLSPDKGAYFRNIRKDAWAVRQSVSSTETLPELETLEQVNGSERTERIPGRGCRFANEARLGKVL